METTRALGSRYRLEELIGVGAMGAVYRTREVGSGRYLAAKVLKPEYTQDPEVVGRFVQERSILVSLDHPNIVSVHDLVVDGGDLAIVMDLIDGQDLRAHLRDRGTFAPVEAVAIASTLLDALAYAHQQNCLHRDIKPDNVLVAGADLRDESSLRLSDFSISRLADVSTVKATGLLGTPEYMPPELFADGTFSAASDVYAMGVLLYELLAGRTPFAGSGNAFTIGNRHVGSLPPPLPLPPALWQVLSGMLDKDPRRRLTAAGTAAALRELDVDGVAALPVQPEPATWSPAAPVAASGATGYVPAISDVGATQVKVDGLASGDVLPVTAGDAVALAPAAEGLEVGQTAVVARQAQHVAPRVESLAPEVKHAKVDAADPRSKMMLVVGGVLAAVLVVVLVVVVGGGSSGGGGGDGSTLQGSADTETYASGLDLAVSATGAGDEATLVATFAVAGGGVVRGPFLVAVPAYGKGSCPKPGGGLSWSAGSAAAFQSTLGKAGTSCAWSVGDSGTEVRSSKTFVVKASLDTGGSVDQGGLQEWATAATDATTAALDEVGPNSPDFIAQRIVGLQVDSPDSISKGDYIDLRVSARWRDGETTENPIFTTENFDTDIVPPVLSALGVTRYGLDDSTCDGNIETQGRGLRLKAVRHLIRPCTVTVTVGEVEGESDDMTVY